MNKKVIIIGAGMSGLVLGNLLQRKGCKVILFEKHVRTGGCTAGFFRKGHYFESGTLSFECSNTVFSMMKEFGIRDKVRFVKHQKKWVSPDFKSPITSYVGLKKVLKSSFPEEKTQLDSYFHEIDRIHDAAYPLLTKPFPFLFGNIEMIIRTIPLVPSIIKCFNIYKKYKYVTINEFTSRYFDTDSKIYRFLTNTGYPKMSVWMMAGVWLHSLLDDYWVPQGGMQAWADVLAENFTGLGGDLRCGNPVTEIVVEGRTAVGVKCRDEIITADLIISALDYKKTYLDLLKNKSLLSQKIRTKIKKAPVSDSVFTAYLGLNLPNSELSNYLGTSYQLYFDLDHDIADINPKDPNFFEKPAMFIYSPSLVNPDLAPKGKSSLMIQSISPLKWMSDWEMNDRPKHLALKRKVEDTFVRRIETLVPNLSKYIDFMDSANPHTYERYTGSTSGATSAWSWDPNKSFYDNGIGVGFRTPIKHLYTCSSWSSQFGGVPGAVAAAYLFEKIVRFL